MPGGWDSYGQAVNADGPIAWYRFNELLAGSPVTAGSQDPQNFCFDSAGGGQAPYISGLPDGGGNVLQYGSAVLSNQPSLLLTNGAMGDPGGAVVFPSTASTSLNNIVTGGSSTPAVLQPTAAITVAAWHNPAVFVGSSAKQMMVCYGSDASSLAAYSLYHLGSSTSNHQFAFSVNIAGTLKTATATLPILVAGKTYHAAGTYDGVNVRIYVNGVLQGTTAATGAISYASIASLGLAFGNDPSNTDANIQGTLDEVGIYNKALSATRIAYQYRQGATFLPFVWNH